MGGSFLKVLPAATVLALVGTSVQAGPYEIIEAKPLSKTYFYGDYWVDAKGDLAKKLSITVGYSPRNPGEELLELHVNRNKQMMLLVARMPGESAEIPDLEKMSREEIKEWENTAKENLKRIYASDPLAKRLNVRSFKLETLAKGMNCSFIRADLKMGFRKEDAALIQCVNPSHLYQFRLVSVNRDLHWTWLEDLKSYAKFKLEEWRPEWEAGSAEEVPPSVADSIGEILPPPGEEMPPQLEKLPLMPMPEKPEPAKAPAAAARPIEKVELTPPPVKETVKTEPTPQAPALVKPEEPKTAYKPQPQVRPKAEVKREAQRKPQKITKVTPSCPKGWRKEKAGNAEYRFGVDEGLASVEGNYVPLLACSNRKRKEELRFYRLEGWGGVYADLLKDPNFLYTMRFTADVKPGVNVFPPEKVTVSGKEGLVVAYHDQGEIISIAHVPFKNDLYLIRLKGDGHNDQLTLRKDLLGTMRFPQEEAKKE